MSFCCQCSLLLHAVNIVGHNKPEENDISYSFHTTYRPIFVIFKDVATKFIALLQICHRTNRPIGRNKCFL